MAASEVRKSSASRSRSPTEERLLESTLELIRRGGLQSLTTVAIAKGAGIRQPNFYAYFRNIDDCLAEAARYVTEQFGEQDAEAFRPVRRAVECGEPYLELACEYHERLLDQLLSEPDLTSLFLRHRYDESPFGRELMAFEQRSVDRVLEHLWDWAIRLGLDGRHLSEVRLLAELQVSAVMTAALSLLDGRSRDRRAVARTLAYNADSTTRGTFRRLLSERRPDVGASVRNQNT